MTVHISPLPGAVVMAGLMMIFVGLSGVYAANYYVDNRNPAASDSGPGSLLHPWSGLEAVDSHTFAPGDAIHFATGSSYTGALKISSSGRPGRPIRLSSYGRGAMPLFSRSGGLNILTIAGSNIVVDGLKFTHTATMSEWDNHTYVDSGAILIRQGANNVTVTNCEFTKVGVGVKSYGLYTKVTRSYFHDLVIAYSDSTLSYGAIGISLDNSDGVVSYNRFVNCRSTDSPYGADGGAIEIEGLVNEKNDILINHNYSKGSQGFIEVTETQSKNVTISYNVSDDYQQFVAFDTTTTPYHYKVYQNTIVRTHYANATNVFTIFYYRDEGFPPTDSWLNIENNIFYTPTAKALNGTYSYKPFDFPHSHNVFYDTTSDPIGYPPGPGDVIADPRFVDLAAHNLHLSSDSPAIAAGVPLGFTKDLDNNPVPAGRAPDDGAYEYEGQARHQ